VVVLGVVAGLVLRGDRRRAIQLLLLAVLPTVLWRLHVGTVLWSDWGIRGFLDHPADLGLPLAGFRDLWGQVRANAYYGGSPEFARAAVAFPALLTGGLLVSAALAVRAPSPFNVAALIYAGIAVCLNYTMIWVHIGNGQRGTYELFVTLALCVLAWRSYPVILKVVLGGFWLAAAWYTTFGAFDAAALRVAAHLPF
jgi:hypothetical protein